MITERSIKKTIFATGTVLYFSTALIQKPIDCTHKSHFEDKRIIICEDKDKKPHVFGSGSETIINAPYEQIIINPREEMVYWWQDSTQEDYVDIFRLNPDNGEVTLMVHFYNTPPDGYR